MKKLISVVMCLCLIAGCIPASAFAECSGRTDLQHAIARYDGHVDSIDEGDNYSDYYYSDSYFYGSSYEYNVSLATMPPLLKPTSQRISSCGYPDTAAAVRSPI